MANPEQPTGAGQESAKGQAAAGLSARGAARRRFTGAGVKASGVILTLASQPGMAVAGQVVTTPSGFTSAHWNSHSPGSTYIGRSPGYWKNRPQEWARYLNKDAAFGSVFSCRTELKQCSLYDVCASIGKAGDLDRYNVASHIVATLLNVRANLLRVLTEQRVLAIWSEYDATGFFVPSAGASPWSGADIVFYLKSTMD